MPVVEDRMRYLFRNRRDIAAAGDLTHEYWCRPGEILVAEGDMDRIRPEFRRWEIRELTEDDVADRDRRAADEAHFTPRPAAEGFQAAGDRQLVRLRCPRRVDVPSVVQRFRQMVEDIEGGPEPRIAPHHVLMGVQVYRAGTHDDPEPAEEPGWAGARGGQGRGARVAVLDTGLADHPALAGRATGDAEVIDEDGDAVRDEQSGHGTFAAGRVLERAPGAQVQAVRVLDSFGITDELTVAAAIEGLADDVDVVNLSLGGYTHDNTAPMALSRALNELSDRVAVVTAAGNYGKARPFWPAALKRCVAVGALDGSEPAEFSNYGWWVDAWAQGMKVTGAFLELDAAASGVDAAFDGWARWSGTSFAAPFVAGAIAAATGPGGDARLAAYDLLRDADRPPNGFGGVIG